MNRLGIAALLALAAVLGGCSDRPAPGAKDAGTRPSTPAQVVNYMTGKTAVDAGKKAKDTVQRVSAQKRGELDEAMEK
jgi:hypothetical protein